MHSLDGVLHSVVNFDTMQPSIWLQPVLLIQGKPLVSSFGGSFSPAAEQFDTLFAGE